MFVLLEAKIKSITDKTSEKDAKRSENEPRLKN